MLVSQRNLVFNRCLDFSIRNFRERQHLLKHTCFSPSASRDEVLSSWFCRDPLTGGEDGKTLKTLFQLWHSAQCFLAPSTCHSPSSSRVYENAIPFVWGFLNSETKPTFVFTLICTTSQVMGKSTGYQNCCAKALACVTTISHYRLNSYIFDLMFCLLLWHLATQISLPKVSSAPDRRNTWTVLGHGGGEMLKCIPWWDC